MTFGVKRWVGRSRCPQLLLSFTIIKKTKTIRKTTKKIKYFYIKRKITDTLVIRNSLNTIFMLELPIQPDIRV
jgi:hypothetical protein